MTQSDGVAARDEGMARAEAGAGSEWMDEALNVVWAVATKRIRFTADDLWLAGLPPHNEHRALGPLMRKAHRLGYIEPTDTFVTSARRSRHAGPMRVWRSCIWIPA
jgi:hypothetical protein